MLIFPFFFVNLMNTGSYGNIRKRKFQSVNLVTNNVFSPQSLSTTGNFVTPFKFCQFFVSEECQNASAMRLPLTCYICTTVISDSSCNTTFSSLQAKFRLDVYFLQRNIDDTGTFICVL